MEFELTTFSGCGGTSLPVHLWMPDGEPKAVLQITHGMTEHMGRYARLAEELCAHGIAAAGFDLRGHGRNPGDPRCASCGEGGWEASLEDMHLFYGFLQQRFGGCHHFMLGFSLGSFLLREYMNRNNSPVAGTVILGTGCQPGAVLSLMSGIVNTQIRKAGFDASTPLVRKLSFDTYNQKFAPNRTPSDWLCADNTELDAYLADPLCRENISAGLFRELLCSMKRTGGKDAYVNWHKDIPVLLLSGAEDPVGVSGKGVEKVKSAMERAEFEKVSVHLFDGARHDLLHEEDSGNADRARRILLDWMTAIIG